jgi:hypothetical protein
VLLVLTSLWAFLLVMIMAGMLRLPL